MSQCFSLDEPGLIEIGLRLGVLDHYRQLLSSSDSHTIVRTLWGISNITASTHAHIATVLADEPLLDQVLTLISNPNQRIRIEALYVVCNAITCSSTDTQQVRPLFDQKRCGLLEPLIDALDKGQV